MRLKIHRGTHQVGGTVTEISTERTRIIIDFGKQFPDTRGDIPLEDLEIEGLTYEGTLYDAVIFTHYHGDHTGLLSKIMPEIPTYIGQAAKEILLLQQRHKKKLIPQQMQQMKTYVHGKAFQVGELRITPILTDHSAFDAYMLLIEGEGCSILHTGDFRTHGYKGELLIPALQAYRGRLDVLITEGTNLSVKNPITVTESALSTAARILMGRYKYTFILCGFTDVDRVLSFYNASVEKSYFYCHSDQLSILKIAEEVNPGLYNFNQAEDLKHATSKDSFSMIVGSGKIYRDILERYKMEFADQTLFIYSMSESYHKENKKELDKIMDGFPYTIKLHTSGHGPKEAIWQVANTVRPTKAIIPIHTTAPEMIRVGELQEKVVYLVDGQWFLV